MFVSIMFVCVLQQACNEQRTNPTNYFIILHITNSINNTKVMDKHHLNIHFLVNDLSSIQFQLFFTKFLVQRRDHILDFLRHFFIISEKNVTLLIILHLKLQNKMRDLKKHGKHRIKKSNKKVT